MNDVYAQLTQLLADLGLTEVAKPSCRNNPSGLPSAWLTLPAFELPRFAAALAAVGGRLATTAVYRPDPAQAPGTHEVGYHFVLGGMPTTVKVRLVAGEALCSIARQFPNADWEEREIMELSGVPVAGHPNPRRLLLDETIEAGVFDRYVPYSEFTNAADSSAVWARIKQEAARRQAGAPARETQP